MAEAMDDPVATGMDFVADLDNAYPPVVHGRVFGTLQDAVQSRPGLRNDEVGV